MNVFARLACRRTLKVYVPRETLWTRTNRYHANVSGSVEGTAKTAVPRARWGRHGAAPTDLSKSQ